MSSKEDNVSGKSARLQAAAATQELDEAVAAKNAALAKKAEAEATVADAAQRSRTVSGSVDPTWGQAFEFKGALLFSTRCGMRQGRRCSLRCRGSGGASQRSGARRLAVPSDGAGAFAQ